MSKPTPRPKRLLPALDKFHTWERRFVWVAAEARLDFVNTDGVRSLHSEGISLMRSQLIAYDAGLELFMDYVEMPLVPHSRAAGGSRRE